MLSTPVELIKRYSVFKFYDYVNTYRNKEDKMGALRYRVLI